MRKDWGFSALVEIAGKRILFDTGDDRDIFAANVKAKNVDLTKLDFVVLSHRHSDHMAGLAHVLSVNPTVKIYAPKEGFGIFGSSLPSSFYRKAEALPPDMRYFDGNPPEVMTFGSAWAGRQLRAHRQDDRNRPRHHPHRPCGPTLRAPVSSRSYRSPSIRRMHLCWWSVARIPGSTRSSRLPPQP